MVSFSCEACGDILTKKQLDPHRSRCRAASFTCIDCMVHFCGLEYRAHTSCISEQQKYQGALYQDRKAKGKPSNTKATQHLGLTVGQSLLPNQNKKIRLGGPTVTTEAVTPAFCNPADSKMGSVNPDMYRVQVDSQLDEHFNAANVNQYLQHDVSQHKIPPAAPSPPPACPAEQPPTRVAQELNVFDFYVGQATPSQSRLNIAHDALPSPPVRQTDTQLARAGNNDQIATKKGETSLELKTPISASTLSQKKRKRLHVETNSPPDAADTEMTEAPPILLHSGLTGGFNRMTVFPPSPDSSSGGRRVLSPTTRHELRHARGSGHHSSKTHSKEHSSKHSKRHSKEGKTSSSQAHSKDSSSKSYKRKSESSPKSVIISSKRTKSSRSERHGRSERSKEKADTQRPTSKDGKNHVKDKENEKSTAATNHNAMIVYREPVDLFMALVNKGPESMRGSSLNKTLKRFYCERQEAEGCRAKPVEEKELFRTLRVKRNDRGEIVLFCLPESLRT